MRFIPALLLALGLLAPGPGFAAVCAGNSMLDEIEHDRPEIWKKALADLEATQNSTGLFWKIAKEGTSPSWLLGTMHIPDPEITAFRPAVVEAFAKSDVLVLELAEDLSESKLAMAEKLLPLARLPEGESFDSSFTKQQKDSLAEMTAAVGMPYFVARRMKPWFLSLTLAMPPCVHIAMLRGEQGVDEKLHRDALAAGKPVAGLETIDEQLAAIASLEKGIGPDALLELVELGPDMIADLLATMLDSYLQERPSLDLLLTLNMPEFRQSADAFRAIEGALLHDRNLRMHDRLLPILEQGNAFVGVGALHLQGDDGLVELLRASGYTVTRVE
jgi:uncharacterized protein